MKCENDSICGLSIMNIKLPVHSCVIIHLASTTWCSPLLNQWKSFNQWQVYIVGNSFSSVVTLLKIHLVSYLFIIDYIPLKESPRSKIKDFLTNIHFQFSKLVIFHVQHLHLFGCFTLRNSCFNLVTNIKLNIVEIWLCKYVNRKFLTKYVHYITGIRNEHLSHTYSPLFHWISIMANVKNRFEKVVKNCKEMKEWK